MTKQNTYRQRIAALIGSPKFFWGIVALLVLQAAWIACTGRYPMAFDEDFHLGIIRLYAHHLSPFWSGQPPGAGAFGAVARDPSYLYQYLMSFPCRLISVFTQDQTVQVLWLRAINIGLFAIGLGVYRRVMLKTGASRAIVHACLLLFVLIPVVPLLAAQVNYDNLFLPVVGLTLLLTIDFSAELRRHKRINGVTLLWLGILCLLGSLIKYAFLPVFAAVVCYLVVRVWRTYGGLGAFWKALRSGLQRIGRRTRWALTAGLVLSCVLFGQRYGVNLVQYHTPIPDCSQVLSVQECSSYGPWIRDYNLAASNTDPGDGPITFTADWFYGMWLRLFFAVDGPGTGFQTKGPFVVPAISAIVFAVAGAVLALGYARRIFRKYDAAVLGLLATVTVLYVGALWFDEFRAYVRTGEAVAINGRYLFPVLPFALLAGALGVNELLRKWFGLKVLVGCIALGSLLCGGGALTYILRSQPAWYWPSPAVRTVNHAVQKTLGPITPGYRRPGQFLH